MPGKVWLALKSCYSDSLFLPNVVARSCKLITCVCVTHTHTHTHNSCLYSLYCCCLCLCLLPSALCPLPSALCLCLCLCLCPSALCPLPLPLCSLPSALCPLLSALCSLLSALCSLLSALSYLLRLDHLAAAGGGALRTENTAMLEYLGSFKFLPPCPVFENSSPVCGLHRLPCACCRRRLKQGTKMSDPKSKADIGSFIKMVRHQREMTTALSDPPACHLFGCKTHDRQPPVQQAVPTIYWLRHRRRPVCVPVRSRHGDRGEEPPGECPHCPHCPREKCGLPSNMMALITSDCG